MLKPKEYGVEDSNVEGLGGEEDRALRKGAAQTEPAWRRWREYLSGDILKHDEAVTDSKGQRHHIEVFRIEKFKVKFWPREKIGTFCSGDSYIILHTFENKEGKVYWDLHFWLGKDTTQDEMGTAAYKTVELDTLLDDGPVQRREVEGYESDLFMAMFTNILECGGVRYQEGGIDSGFRHVEPESYKPRLLHLKGRKKVRVTQVDMSTSSLNSGDLFVLDAGLKIICWRGKEAGMFERNKGRELCSAIRTERKGKAEVLNVVEGDVGPESDLFYQHLGGSASDPIKSAEEGGNDVESRPEPQKILFRLSDAGGSLTFTKTGEGSAVNAGSLDTKDVFILDAGYSIFAWVGKGATRNEKNNAIPYATQYLNDYNRPMHLPIVRVLEGGEPLEFKQAIR